jgi:hypothetical protein
VHAGVKEHHENSALGDCHRGLVGGTERLRFFQITSPDPGWAKRLHRSYSSWRTAGGRVTGPRGLSMREPLISSVRMPSLTEAQFWHDRSPGSAADIYIVECLEYLKLHIRGLCRSSTSVHYHSTGNRYMQILEEVLCSLTQRHQI